MDARNGTTVNGFLDLLFGSSGGVVNFREVFIIQPEDLRTEFDTKSARDTFILINHWDLIHENPPFFRLPDPHFPFK
jgi:hypothetical protein